MKKKTINFEYEASAERLKQLNKKFKNADLTNDIKFRELCTSKEAIQELLRYLLKDKGLVVVEIIPQSDEKKPIFHGVILDCKCRLSTKEIVNIELQVSQNDNVECRMRYNGAILTVENTPKKENFKYSSIPKIILIMICDFDLYSKNEFIYEIERREKHTGILCDNGIREFYINLCYEGKDKNINSLISLFKDINYMDNEVFPAISKQKERVNNLALGGEENMSDLAKMIYSDGEKSGKKKGIEEGMQKGMQKGIQKGRLSILIDLVKQNLLDVADAAKTLGMPVSEFNALLKA